MTRGVHAFNSSCFDDVPGISGEFQSCFFHLPFCELIDTSAFRQPELITIVQS